MEREQKSADEIAALIRHSTSVVPGLENVGVEVVRLSVPDAQNCNWIARHAPLPVGCPAESERLLRDIIENARRHFNLWEVH